MEFKMIRAGHNVLYNNSNPSILIEWIVESRIIFFLHMKHRDDVPM